MKEKAAVRNLRLCTKDCLCLYVCPVGATDTEDSVIDVSRCIGCGACADACPSGAISMVPLAYPPQQKKEEGVLAHAYPLAESKARQERLAARLAEDAAGDEGLRRLMAAAARSVRLVNEDLLRESGYMLPQSGNAHALLEGWVKAPPPGFPVEAARRLLELLPNNDAPARPAAPAASAVRTYRCKVCGYVFEAAGEEKAVCPLCLAEGDALELLEER